MHPRLRMLLAVPAALATLAATAGCVDGSGSDGKSGELHMGIAVANISLNFAHEMVLGAESAASHRGNIDFKAVGPPNTDGPAEVQLFQNLTARAKDGIVLENLDPPIFTRPAARAVDQGIPVVALDTSPTEGSKVGFYVGNDNYALGELMAKEALERLGGDPKGQIVIGVPNPGTPVLDNRAEGIADTFAKEAPDVEVLGPFQTYSDPGQNYSSWSAQVNAHPEALAFLGVGDADSYNLAKIKKAEHGTWLTAGFDVDPKTLDAVKDGSNFVTIDPQHFLKGYLSTAMLIDAVRDHDGKLPEGWFLSPGGVVDTSNIDEIITRQKSAKAAYDWYKPTIDKLLGNQKAQLKPLKDAR
ncbi:MULTISPECIES: sugar ABC transporter substrate-binding protein [unclassified Streptomyces]|uniref:sugar ABC transporter substrate-binding protein n=1 Tax=unclassified Streptomyces TaxID=2593676 RepID=UPI00225B357F|nr:MULTISPECIES: sugar ABC transporter substrate-binding protein [unclassified Streptomyces]MCX4987264.1 sugar ABC transporter substrate-binding protein [Streptomyces sp. NBC_00568]MCX5007604.1 sugar ABC transporter substrate-binding protein [Streptomyces sp. NBC_00638]